MIGSSNLDSVCVYGVPFGGCDCLTMILFACTTEREKLVRGPPSGALCVINRMQMEIVSQLLDKSRSHN